MIVIKRLVRRTPFEVTCTIERTAGEQTFNAIFTQDGPHIRGVDFPELSEVAMRELSNCDEFRAFIGALFRFQDSDHFDLPFVVISDLVASKPKVFPSGIT